MFCFTFHTVFYSLYSAPLPLLAKDQSTSEEASSTRLCWQRHHRARREKRRRPRRQNSPRATNSWDAAGERSSDRRLEVAPVGVSLAVSQLVVVRSENEAISKYTAAEILRNKRPPGELSTVPDREPASCSKFFKLDLATKKKSGNKRRSTRCICPFWRTNRKSYLKIDYVSRLKYTSHCWDTVCCHAVMHQAKFFICRMMRGIQR